MSAGPAPASPASPPSPRGAALRPWWQPIVYWFCWFAAYFFGVVFYRLRRFGAERLPPRGPVLIVANHQSHLDPPLLGSSSSVRQWNFIARIGLFRHRGFGWLITALNSIPVKDDGEADLAAMREALARLARGEVVMIFAEGTRSPDGALHEFLRGVTVLVKRAKCPVMPAAIEGAFDAWPRGRAFPRLWGRRVAIAYGEPIPHEELLRDGPEEALRRLAREVETLRLGLRSKLRAATRGRLPRPGPGDAAADPSAWYRAADAR